LNAQRSESIYHANFPANKLILEVIGSAVIEDMDQAITTLKEISQKGIFISFDNFGTDYYSLNYLRKLPIYE